MMFYGRKIINDLFKRRTKRTQLCAKLATRSEADRDRCDIRVFETGLSTQQYGDYEYGAENAACKATLTIIS